MRTLLAAGADPLAKGSMLRTPTDYAKTDEVRELLAAAIAARR